ncbi:Eco57I restriction-modification methylase domain-containing protein, partial [Staphylococcus pseudintermedius]
MEFPEILGDNGEFIGFDLLIGNPPYIFSKNQSFTEEMKTYYMKT